MSTPAYPPAAQAARVIIARQALAKLQQQADGLLARIPAAQAALEEEEALLRHLTGHPAAASAEALLGDVPWCAAVVQRYTKEALTRLTIIDVVYAITAPAAVPAGLPLRVLAAITGPLPPAIRPAPPPAGFPAGAAR